MNDHDATLDTDGVVLLAAHADPGPASGAAVRAIDGPTLHLGDKVYQLRPGDNIVGRGEDVDVRLASSSVSRRHASIRIDASDEALLEDLQSRNGTMTRDRRVESPTRLHDGDAVRFGVVWLVYRASAAEVARDE